MISASLNNQFRRWASNWEALEDTLQGIQLEKKALCAEIRDASSRQTLQAFTTAMRIMHMDETKQATRVAIRSRGNLDLEHHSVGERRTHYGQIRRCGGRDPGQR